MSSKIMFDSDEAAVYEEHTVKAWWTADGNGFGDEELARYHGCTHRKCDKCGNVFAKNSYCEICHNKKVKEKYNGMELVEWDEETPLVMNNTDQYFFDRDSIDEYCYENNCDIEALDLVVCAPITLAEIDEDHWCEEIGDGETPVELKKAIESLNATLKSIGTVAWEAGNTRVTLKP